ncbi:FAD/NAD(P)-binding oxidoreductase [Scrofimicrobium sp. R131]|uniref:FAD/NAD(P)-binding oxidoreductase n=1 Tax=Scrofimicrobium appendicitidis TaxID=3079930 RepID=A0AAU7V637_9ACTO
MADVVVLGGGISGHTAALHLRKRLGKNHTVTVVTPNSNWNWIPSNIWVGVGVMPMKKVVFPLAPVYKKKGIKYVQAKATQIYPNGSQENSRPGVVVEYTGQGKQGHTDYIAYDYLINATGPRLKFEMTEGLGPDQGFTASVCTAQHAVEAAEGLKRVIAAAKAGQHQTVVVGTGHGTCTCEGAAFEYTFNVNHELVEAGVRDKVRLVYLTNEAELGDFGVGGMIFNDRGYETTSQLWTESLFRERGVDAIIGAGVKRVTENMITYEDLDGNTFELEFDYAMLLPPFGGQPLEAIDADGSDLTSKMFAPSGFMKVDADYTPKPYEEWSAKDWPRTYESPEFPNVFAVGIAFAPPHPISRPRTNPNGTAISPAPPRTGMPSGVMGKTVALTIVDRINKGPSAPAHSASMAAMGAACVASAGTGLRQGSAAAMTMMPVVPDYEKYQTGRDLRDTRGEIGLHGHWVKLMLHYLFLYKAKARPFWYLIPE